MVSVPFRKTQILGVFLALAAAAAASTTARAEGVPPAVPEGVTLVEVVRELEYAQPEFLWIRPGDSVGRTLFVRDGEGSGSPHPRSDAEAQFLPLLAPPGAREAGDWTLVPSGDGGRQWAYQGQPLYTWSKERVPGEVATNVGLAETANSKLAQIATEAGDLLPPDGWSVVRFTPAKAISLPVEIDVTVVPAAQAVVLTDSSGYSLYTFAGDSDRHCAAGGCEPEWRALVAPELAKGTGEFSAVRRFDGTKQWAYKGKPLFTYAGDKLPGDALGAGKENWSIAAVSRNFRPEGVDVTFLEGYGAALTFKGMTLYGGYPFEKRWGGRNLRDTFKNAYYKGKMLGGAACADAECLRTWHPFLAPPDAQPNGFWEPIERDDGSKQWAYKGYALYTYAGDESAGAHYGQATYDFEFDGRAYDFNRIAFLQDIANGTMKRANTNGGVGIYWNIAKP